MGKSIKYYSSVKEKDVKWFWYPYIPYGKITSIQGDPGDGKSIFVLRLAAVLTCGGELPDGEKIAKPANVIYQCSEDDVNDTIKPRLLEAGADCSKVAFIEDQEMALSLLDERIEQAVKATNAKLVIFDPFQSFIPLDCDMQSASKMRSVMRKISRIAEKYGCAVVMIGHLNKASSGKKLYRGLGSIDITAIARSVLMITRDESNPEIRYMYPIKSSLAPEGRAISFLMDRENGFHWIGKCVLPQDEKKLCPSQTISKKEKAKEVLKIILSDGMVKSSDILTRMEELGISARTVRTAQKELGVVARRKKNLWFWELPSSEEESGCE